MVVLGYSVVDIGVVEGPFTRILRNAREKGSLPFFDNHVVILIKMLFFIIRFESRVFLI